MWADNCAADTSELDREDHFIEINPRFGGGAPLSMKAGADSAEAILHLLLREPVARMTCSLTEGAVYSRLDQSVCVDHGNGMPVRGVIFDLDDTLFQEKDYVRSGYAAVASYLPEVENTADRLWSYFKEGKPVIDCLLKEKGLDIQRDYLLSVYRCHKPSITLSEETRGLLAELRKTGLKLGVITDGRPEGQRNKIAALGLDDLVDDIIITDELGGTQFRKPNNISFRIMQQRWDIPFGQLLYVGDNLAKDFQTPKQLGMRSIWLKNSNGFYSGNTHCIYCADSTIESLPQCIQFLNA